MVCRQLWASCYAAPPTVRAEYLICCWIDSFSLRFTNGIRADSNIPSLQSDFLPTSFPAATLVPRRAATADVLSYAARFGICTPTIWSVLERIVIRSRIFGNICQLHGIFATTSNGHALIPTHLACHVVPERLVRKVKYTNEEYAADVPAVERVPLVKLAWYMMELVPKDARRHACATTLPSPAALELLVRMVLIHHASPNSNQGFLLAMAVHLESLPLICFLLATGANPALKKNIALHIAAKKGHVLLLRLLLERDDRIEEQWREGLQNMADMLGRLDSERHCAPSSVSVCCAQTASNNKPTKRQRLGDRAEADLALLKTAVRSRSWNTVTFLMQSKNVIPDVEALSLMERYGMP